MPNPKIKSVNMVQNVDILDFNIKKAKNSKEIERFRKLKQKNEQEN